MREQSQRGFTVVDILVTMAVIAILGAATLPSVVNSMQTYRRTMAARRLIADLRQVQSLAVSRSEIFSLEWGPSVGRNGQYYRIVRDMTGSCGFPVADAPADGTNVVRSWIDLSSDYPEILISSMRDSDGQDLDEIMFGPMGSSTHTCATVHYPVTISLTDGSGNTEAIEVRKSGMARRL